MHGVSRVTLAALRERLAAREVGHGSAEQVERESGELLAVAALLGRETHLRSSLADASADPAGRAQLAHAVLDGRVSEQSAEIVAEAARGRWSRPSELADALESLGAEAAFALAESAGTLDRVEDELFRVARLVSSSPDLRRTLSDPGLPLEGRRGLLGQLLGDRVDATTLRLLDHVVGSLRGRQLEDALDDLVALAAVRRTETLAEATVAVALTPEQEQRLAAVLGRVYATQVKLQVVVDPTVLGGVVVRVGDEVIDGSVLHRVEQARQTTAGL
ncbi:F-type H+-transporting ATPase subunit delta [Motilibacter rhizosphaerae]|uniref:ATP synthase subunit delta n=1 Tax=Motilibacter rhizosphaerae TaxID=598652 RepID=A0A4Q7NPJ7_9ACTN|nr:F0F1 ATP synthase subunit delta [Motilibacter rhizosphaerae]RZS87103.1 F-type H+-transporting ATPase subunit delta [Motilibacter rhizosphaerae]